MRASGRLWSYYKFIICWNMKVSSTSEHANCASVTRVALDYRISRPGKIHSVSEFNEHPLWNSAYILEYSGHSCKPNTVLGTMRSRIEEITELLLETYLWTRHSIPLRMSSSKCVGRCICVCTWPYVSTYYVQELRSIIYIHGRHIDNNV